MQTCLTDVERIGQEGSPNPGRENNGFNPEYLRLCAWSIGERKPADAFAPTANHAALAMVSPRRGFVHWRILHDWIQQTRCRRGDSWNHCRMILRLYDVSCIIFNGLNAHRIQDYVLPSICGHLYFDLPNAGTWQLAEVGFLLRSGEFISAARSQTVFFARASASPHCGQEALLVDDNLRQERIASLWDQENVLKERRKPKLRKPLRIALLSLTVETPGQPGVLPEFIAKLAANLCDQGHQSHLLIPTTDHFDPGRQLDGVQCHRLDMMSYKTPVKVAQEFGRAADQRLQDLGPFNIIHLHEWMTGLGPWVGKNPTICSFTSVEATRRNGTPPTKLSRVIEEAERQVARSVQSLLVPPWLREKAVAELGVNGNQVHAFAMAGLMPNECDAPMDFGAVKREINFGPLDRLMLFVGPLEYAAGPDLLLEALPILLQLRRIYARPLSEPETCTANSNAALWISGLAMPCACWGISKELL